MILFFNLKVLSQIHYSIVTPQNWISPIAAVYPFVYEEAIPECQKCVGLPYLVYTEEKCVRTIAVGRAHNTATHFNYNSSYCCKIPVWVPVWVRNPIIVPTSLIMPSLTNSTYVQYLIHGCTMHDSNKLTNLQSKTVLLCTKILLRCWTSALYMHMSSYNTYVCDCTSIALNYWLHLSLWDASTYVCRNNWEKSVLYCML